MNDIVIWLSVLAVVVIVTEIIMHSMRNTIKAMENANPMGMNLDFKKAKKI